VRRATVRRVEGPTLPPLPSTVVESDPGFPSYAHGSATPMQSRSPSAPRPVSPAPMPRPIVQAPRPVAAPPPRPVAVAPRPYGRIVTCCWPLGEPGTREFRFCDVPSEPGRPYCEDHVKLAYVKVRDRRDDAA
jgi:GcrA cell cycle regulator